MTKGMNIYGRVHSPTVSVIIPTHNRGKMLCRAIDSVLNQTYKDFELIVVSDGCIDNTDEIVASYADSRISFLTHEKSRGASAARNTGIRASTGQYIAFLDDDDEWTSNKLEIQFPLIVDSPPEIALVYAWMEYFQDGKSIKVHTPKLRGDVFVEMLDKQAIGGCPTIMIKRCVINKVGYFDETLPRGNDGDYWRRIARYYHVDYVPQILAKIHVGHADRISTNSTENLKSVIWALKKRLKDFEAEFRKHPKKKKNVLSNISKHYYMVGEFSAWFGYLRKALSCCKNVKEEILLICDISKLTLLWYFKKLRYGK